MGCKGIHNREFSSEHLLIGGKKREFSGSSPENNDKSLEVLWTDQNDKKMLFMSFPLEQYNVCCMDNLAGTFFLASI